MGAKVRDMWRAARVVINTAHGPLPAPRVPHPPYNTQWGTAIELNFGTVVVVQIRGWFGRSRFVQLRLN